MSRRERYLPRCASCFLQQRKSPRSEKGPLRKVYVYTCRGDKKRNRCPAREACYSAMFLFFLLQGKSESSTRHSVPGGLYSRKASETDYPRHLAGGRVPEFLLSSRDMKLAMKSLKFWRRVVCAQQQEEPSAGFALRPQMCAEKKKLTTLLLLLQSCSEFLRRVD